MPHDAILNFKAPPFFILGILGMSGSGKSTFTEGIVRPLRRAVIFDYQHDDLFDGYEVVKSLKSYSDAVARDEFSVVFRAKRVTEYIEAIEHTADNVRDVSLVFDELAVYAPSRRAPEVMSEVFFRGRRRGYSIIWNSHRPQGVDVDIRSQTHTYCVFQTVEPNDIKFLEIPPIERRDIKNFKWGEFRLYRDANRFHKWLIATKD